MITMWLLMPLMTSPMSVVEKEQPTRDDKNDKCTSALNELYDLTNECGVVGKTHAEEQT